MSGAITEDQVAIIRKWEHFDPAWYLNEYADVRMLGLDPAFHYLWLGAQIGRRPSANFNRFPSPGLKTDDFVRKIERGRFNDQGVFEDKFIDKHAHAQPAEFIQNNSIDPAEVQDMRVAVHAHMYYADLANEFASYLSRVPCSFDLYASTSNEEARRSVEGVFSTIPNVGKLDVRVVPNIGRDIAPMVVEFGKVLASYEVVAHIQTKKSLYNNGSTDGWRESILQTLFSDPRDIAYYLRLLNNNRYGIIYPQCFYNLPYMANTWLANAGLARAWSQRFGLEALPDGYFDFPAGSMFWARADAIRPLLEAGLTWEDFPAEEGQTDGTLAHCIERMLGVVPTYRHYQHGVIRDTRYPSWSRWRLNQFIDRPIEINHAIISDNRTKIVAFDIFDTLIQRPMLDPDYVKHLLHNEHENAGFQRFRDLRVQSEAMAREAKGRDVDIYDIYRHLTNGIIRPQAAPTADREIELEFKSVRSRPDTIELLQYALRAGKKVVLASDMFLPRKPIEAMLERCGVKGWQTLYLSSEVGLRKDTGKLYEHILAQEKITPENMVMVGDNERSDFQIPADMGMRVIHLVKPAYVMRATPRFAGLVPDASKATLDNQFLFGAIAAKNFAGISNPGFSPENMFGGSAREIGYGLLGPIVATFSQWLVKQSLENKISQLYFLAREGKFLKQAYDVWQKGLPGTVLSDYLLISRRAVTVPSISSLDDIFNIARSNAFFGASMDMFLDERFGTVLDQKTWKACERAKLWSRGNPLTIEHGDISHIEPFLRFIEPEIVRQAGIEREHALRYYADRGLSFGDAEAQVAVVDVGYGATIQRHLIKLLDRKVHGFYMMTNAHGGSLKHSDGVLAEGCFARGVNGDPGSPLMFLQSFLLEKMLSADDEQVLRYNGAGAAEFRAKGEYPAEAEATRRELQQGALDFVRDAARFRDEMAVELRFEPEICKELYARFASNLSVAEKKVFQDLALDDFYCGRGIVTE